jgi:hypothetical protein
MKNILGFWHIWAINEYYEIVAEQFRLILESGLYCNCENIYVGCIGTKENILKLELFFSDYKKIKIISTSQNAIEYEYLTLRLLKNAVSHSCVHFYGFYIHTKGVSFPGHEGGKYWRDYMNYYNLTDWRIAYKSLESGHDTYGVKLLTEKDEPAHKLHYSKQIRQKT